MADTKKKAVSQPKPEVTPEEIGAVTPEEIGVINTQEDKPTEVDYIIEYQKSNGAIIPVIDGVKHPELVMGYTSEADLKAGMDTLRKALKATDGNIQKAMMYMYSAAMTTAEGIKPDEEVEVDGIRMMLEYGTKKIYTMERAEVANLDDIEVDMPEAAIKALLVERAKNWIAEKRLEEIQDEYWDDEEDY